MPPMPPLSMQPAEYSTPSNDPEWLAISSVSDAALAAKNVERLRKLLYHAEQVAASLQRPRPPLSPSAPTKAHDCLRCKSSNHTSFTCPENVFSLLGNFRLNDIIAAQCGLPDATRKAFASRDEVKMSSEIVSSNIGLPSNHVAIEERHNESDRGDRDDRTNYLSDRSAERVGVEEVESGVKMRVSEETKAATSKMIEREKNSTTGMAHGIISSTDLITAPVTAVIEAIKNLTAAEAVIRVVDLLVLLET
ncbi:hypothetical protein HDU84_006880 [Entophlyctis sp. JEL0112]|nr:hypothetical protein HDU84_006880 [Entophlyctis sp. JEL0112]